MHAIHYTYDVKIAQGSELLREEMLGEHFPSIGELVVTSRLFDDYEVCEKAFTGLLSVLCAANTQATKKNHVIVTKSNPIHAEGAVVHPEENWDKYTVMRAFVADAEALQAKTLKFNIIGQIKVDPTTVEMVKELAIDAPTQ
jgi:hypothetical protein